MVELSLAGYTLRITKMSLLNYRGAYILIPSPVTEGDERGGAAPQWLRRVFYNWLKVILIRGNVSSPYFSDCLEHGSTGCDSMMKQYQNWFYYSNFEVTVKEGTYTLAPLAVLCAWIKCVLYMAKYGYIINYCKSEIIDFWTNHSSHL